MRKPANGPLIWIGKSREMLLQRCGVVLIIAVIALAAALSVVRYARDELAAPPL